MGQYYYTVSSLPFLDFETEPSITVVEFFDNCQSTLTEQDFKILSSVSLSKVKELDPGIPLINEWLSWEGTLRNEIVKLRAVSMGVESETYLYEIESNTTSPGIARAAYKLDSPLAAEESMDRARWSFLDELEVGHHFDLEKLIVYSLRLQLLERKAMFNTDNGKDNFQKIYENIKEAVREA